MVEISRAMEYMHSAHVVHGDLKGENVLLDNDLRCLMAEHSLLTKENMYTHLELHDIVKKPCFGKKLSTAVPFKDRGSSGYSTAAKHLEGLMSGLSFYRDRQTDSIESWLCGSSHPPQQFAPSTETILGPPTDMHASESSVPGRTESFSGLIEATLCDLGLNQCSLKHHHHKISIIRQMKISLQSPGIDILVLDLCILTRTLRRSQVIGQTPWTNLD
ncbi:hypothetical protein BT96DRAFT_1010290 [Gymnopus androsaceus JB14]|uniref:Protein kinase domain-containing protein n=1 Tax=Gymnopus androsaceus JB14 TaxID=1447944 RepID=A0A6A4GAX1_9AGAR|nr:hypothetical protein BT96DRAFT_1010290 [Gymnopus androsaceus JB14]